MSEMRDLYIWLLWVCTHTEADGPSGHLWHFRHDCLQPQVIASVFFVDPLVIWIYVYHK